MSSGNRGRLKNGAAPGDYLAAPRCGARTRKPAPGLDPGGGTCRQPAMPNGRCRLHGGKSTGARTEAGRARLRLIHTRHGGYGQEAKARVRRVNAFMAETKRLLEAVRAGHHDTATAAADPPSGLTRPADRPAG